MKVFLNVYLKGTLTKCRLFIIFQSLLNKTSYNLVEKLPLFGWRLVGNTFDYCRLKADISPIAPNMLINKIS
jgi:hypothetical protein